jgi:Flp pilus assembly protein TadD
MLVKRFFAQISWLLLMVTSLIVAMGCNSRPRAKSASASAAARNSPAQNTAEARERTDRATALIEKGEDKKARDLLLDALTFDPTYGPTVNNLGVLEFRAGRFYDAAWNFQNAIKLMPQQPEPINNLGMVLEEAGKYVEAEQQYDTAAKLDLRRVEFTANRARVRVRQGKMDEQTRRLLDYIRQYDPRPEWTEWARMTLVLFDARPPAEPPAPQVQPE